MNFEAQQNAIKDYIEEHLPAVLNALKLENFDTHKENDKDKDKILIDDFLNFDRYKQNKMLFIIFDYYNFDGLTNQSNQNDMTLELTAVFRGANRATTKSNMMQYSQALYQMFEESGRCFGGACDFGKVTQLELFPFAEGNPNMKIAQMTIQLTTEV